MRGLYKLKVKTWIDWPTFSVKKKVHGLRAVMKNKWPKSDEKTGFRGTLGFRFGSLSLWPPTRKSVATPLVLGSWPARSFVVNLSSSQSPLWSLPIKNPGPAFFGRWASTNRYT